MMIACEVYVFILDAEKFYRFFSFNVNIFERNCSLFVLEWRNEGNRLTIVGKQAPAFNRNISSGIDVL
ncbi:MAG: hypothetical protein AMK69_24875 [Nitrospira bacterium SG8_3]|nr:MAG: hypothetical protein AMK69_24875 [Nitrospira bacterium SG8_3]